jgi:hypothetical protein
LSFEINGNPVAGNADALGFDTPFSFFAPAQQPPPETAVQAPSPTPASVAPTPGGNSQTPAPTYRDTPVRTYTEPNFAITPIEGDPSKVKIEMKTGAQIAITVTAERGRNADGTLSSSKFYLMFPNGDYNEYERKEASGLPDGQQIPARLDARGYIRNNNGAQQTAQNRSTHQTSSVYSTPPRHDAAFKFPLRMDIHGFGGGSPRLWLAWDVQHEIQVEPVQTKIRKGLSTLIPVYNIKQWVTGNLNGMKFLYNVYTEGSPAPRYFYLKKNKDDSVTIYGDDDIDKLKAIEKGKTN